MRRQRTRRDLSPPENGRVFLGLAVQPFVAGCVAFLTFPALNYTGQFVYGSFAGSLWEGAGSMGVVVGFVGLGITVLGAVPLLAIQLSRGPVSRDHALASGLALGNVPTVLMWLLLISQQVHSGRPPDLASVAYGPVGIVRVVVWGSLIGLAGAATFWWIAGRSIGASARDAGEP